MDMLTIIFGILIILVVGFVYFVSKDMDNL